jgi:hypothetical protein
VVSSIIPAGARALVSSTSQFALLGAATLLAGCFDVHQVDTTATALAWSRERVVDDFEQQNGLPTWNLLLPWTCDAYPEPSNCAFDNEAADLDTSNRAGFMTFDAQGAGAAGAVLTANVAAHVVDVSQYDEIAFSVKVAEAQPGSLPPDYEIRVRLACPTPGDDPTSEPTSVQTAIWPATDGVWRTFSVDLTTTKQPAWQISPRVDPVWCRQHVAAFNFEVASEATGATAVSLAGELAVDDIELKDYGGRNQRDARFSSWYCEGPAGATCSALDEVPSLTFPAVDDDSFDGDPPLFCTRAEKVDPTSHELSPDTRDFGAFTSLSLAARFVAADPGAPGVARFDVSLGCSGLAPGLPAAQREVEVLPSWSSYSLALGDFEPSAFPLGFDNVAGCLEQVDEVCVIAPTGVAASAGTIWVDDLKLR